MLKAPQGLQVIVLQFVLGFAEAQRESGHCDAYMPAKCLRLLQQSIQLTHQLVKTFKLASISHSSRQFRHRRVRWMRSGWRASMPARNGAPGLKPRAGQQRGFAESDGLGRFVPSSTT